MKMTESQPIHKIFAQKILNKKEFLASILLTLGQWQTFISMNVQ